MQVKEIFDYKPQVLPFLVLDSLFIWMEYLINPIEWEFVEEGKLAETILGSIYIYIKVKEIFDYKLGKISLPQTTSDLNWKLTLEKYTEK